MKKILGLFLIGAALLLNCNNAFSATVDVSYGYSGVPGDYLLDFTVTNNMPASYSQKLYFWGVDLANAPAQGIPGSWSDYNTMWNNHSSLGVGSSIDYPSNWLLNNYTLGIASGSSLSGFTVHSSFIPENIHYFAFLYSGGDNPYYGADAFYTGSNPCFEGIVGGEQSTVPEPATMALFGIGTAAMAFARRKKKLA